MKMRFAFLTAAAVGLFGCEQFDKAWEEAFTPPGQKKMGEGRDTEESNYFDPAAKDKGKEKELDFEYVLSFHRIPKDPDRPDMLVSPVVRAGSLEPVIVERNLFCHSRDIDEIRLVPSPDRPNFYGLALHLNKTGRKRWMSMTTEAQGQPLAMLVDKEFCRSFVVSKVFDAEHEEWAMVNVNLSERQAKRIRDAAEKNHKFFNKKPTDFWTL